MPIQSPQELLTYELQAIQDAEKQASQALRQMNTAAENDQLRRMLERRLKQGERILQEVQKSLEKLDGNSHGIQNAAARGLIQESERLLKEVQSPEMKQAVMIAGLQELEHYCIAVWGTVKAMAREAGEQELAQAMERAIEEGYDWDHEMTELAEGRINPAALEQGAQAQSGAQSGSSQTGDGRSQTGQRGSGSGDGDLKSREYRGEDGKIHHHTRDYMERRGK